MKRCAAHNVPTHVCMYVCARRPRLKRPLAEDEWQSRYILMCTGREWPELLLLASIDDRSVSRMPAIGPTDNHLAKNKSGSLALDGIERTKVEPTQIGGGVRHGAESGRGAKRVRKINHWNTGRGVCATCSPSTAREKRLTETQVQEETGTRVSFGLPTRTAAGCRPATTK